MSNKEIINGNFLIAKFMVGSLVGETVNFHSDWNVLMQAVDYIESLTIYECEVELDCIGKGARFIFSDGCRFLGDYNICETKLESIYVSVIQFINYYNKLNNVKN